MLVTAALAVATEGVRHTALDDEACINYDEMRFGGGVA
jgi:hypothetical protein